MRSRCLTGWRITLLAAAVASLVLVPLSQTLAFEPRSEFDNGGGDVRLADDKVWEETALGQGARFARSNYVWPYATGPYYGDVENAALDSRGVLRTSVGSFRLSDGLRQLPAELRTANKLDQHGLQHFIVLVDPDTITSGGLAEVASTIEGRGGVVIGKGQGAALVARLTPAAYAELEKSSKVVGIEPYHAAFKLDPAIGRVPLLDPTQALSEVYDLEIRVFPGENSQVVATLVAKLGGTVLDVWPDTIRAQIHRGKLAELAAIEAVQRIWENLPLIPQAEETTAVVQTGRLNGGPSSGATPYHDAGIDGGGGGIVGAVPQILMILDTGIQLDAADLSDTSAAAGVAGAGHRKVHFYGTTNAFGGAAIRGDDKGCDTGEKGGFTHGQVVASVALGAATRVPLAYGAPYVLRDDNGNPWRVDGVAPGARLVAYDGQLTPAQTSCADPTQNTVNGGDFYSGGATGAMGDAYAKGARIFNFSIGDENNSYTGRAIDIDQFLVDKLDAMTFVSAGNSGFDQDNDFAVDEGSLAEPATMKNGLAIGASRNADDLGGDGLDSAEVRAPFSSAGPAVGLRIAPQLMAPGSDTGETGIVSEFSCLTNDNDQADPVECARRSGLAGTSFSSAAAAGAAMLVRDYFAQGFYPDGRSNNALNANDQVANISGALVKSVLIASADFLNGVGITGQSQLGDNLTKRYRFNNEQGYGRIELDNALPLASWPLSASGLIVADGGIAGGKLDIPGLTGTINASAVVTQTGTFQVCNPNEEIRIALSWIDQVDGLATGALVNDLDLEIQSPSNKVYYGNYFTDDNDKDGVLNVVAEDCPGIDGVTGTISQTEWSLPACVKSITDTDNPTEAIFLSPDPLGLDAYSQIEVGAWTIRVKSAGTGLNATQRYAVALSGGVCQGSSAQLDARQYTCNQPALITVNEFAETGDLAPGPTDIQNRTTVQVLDGNTVVDSESGLTFTQIPGGGFAFESETLNITDRTVPETNNGVLDVRTGNTIRVLYNDVGSDGLPNANKQRVSVARVNCATAVGFGNIVFFQLGQDRAFNILGGCELNRRGMREFGSPDQYMDAGEHISFEFAYASNELIDLVNATVDLKCVIADANSPASCRPNSNECADSNRTDNLRCDQAGLVANRYMSILNTPQTVNAIPAATGLTGNFSVQMAPTITCAAPSVGCPSANSPEVEMILSVAAGASGKTAQGLAISRQRLNVDELERYYSTDFPTGGVEYREWDNNEFINSYLPADLAQPPQVDDPEPIFQSGGGFQADYRFEAITWSDATAGGTKNLAINSPWNFDVTDGAFLSGITATTDEATIGPGTVAQWGEDKNFNGIDDKQCTINKTRACQRDADCLVGEGACESVEQRDPNDGVLDRSWSTRGGCGWVTKAPGVCQDLPTLGCYDDGDCPGTLGPCVAPAPLTGGAWHTGRIGATTGTCLVSGNNPGQCQTTETVGGATGQRIWAEVLETPEIERVGGPEAIVEILDFQWNMSAGLPDDNVVMQWDVDNNSRELEPADLRLDFTFLNGLRGEYDAVLGTNNSFLTDGYPVFAELCTTRGSGQCDGGTNNTGACATNAQCPGGGICRYGDSSINDDGPVSPPCLVEASNLSLNGTDAQGHNRQAKNSCHFEGGAVVGGGVGVQGALDLLGLPKPFDDDKDQNGDGQIDEFVTLAGPIRNMSLTTVNGPDMRFTTVEDFYGKTGQFFKAGIVMRNEEKDSAGETDPAAGYGLGVDDVVLMWREKTLIADTTDCATNGSCATLDVQGGSFFEGRALVLASVVEESPDAVNDCDLDGTIEVGEDLDCDNNGINDLPVRASSQAEIAGEIFYANRVGATTEYRAEIPISNLANVQGVLFIAAVGAENPLVTVSYFDNNDGTGQICKNSSVFAQWGRITGQTTVFLTTGSIVVIDAAVTDNGDNDGWADTNETVSVSVRLRNLGTTVAEAVSVRAASSDPAVECILDATSFVGDIQPNAEATAVDPFTFKISNIDRTGAGKGPLDELVATFGLIISAGNFDSSSAPQTLALDLDLDAQGGSPESTTYFESFEVDTGLGTFTTMNIDAGKWGLVQATPTIITNSDGYRCQYHNPNDPEANSVGDLTCYLGGTQAQADRYHWAVDQPGDVDNSRGYSGTRSLYFGILGPTANTHTTPTGAMEAAGSAAPINLGYTGAPPELSYKHQVSLVDDRSLVTGNGSRASDRAVVHLQLADGADNPVGNWIKLQPYTNVYDTQTQDNYFNCFFDPIDDGNNELTITTRPPDSLRIYGPSSTCYPEFVYAYQGDTFRPFSLTGLGKAAGPALQGQTGLGTWVESKVSLFRFRGRRVRLRFLESSLKIEGIENWEAIFTFNPDPGDDGWWVDDVTVSNTLLEAPTIVNDNKVVALPGCGATCGTVTASLTADPTSLAAPGQAVTLSAVASSADRCLSGTLQYRFCRSADADCGDASDTIMRSYTDNPEIVDSPGITTNYAVDVRCSAAPGCLGSAGLSLPVVCPSVNLFPTVDNPAAIPPVVAVKAPNKTSLTWSPARTYNVTSGLLSSVSLHTQRAGFPLLNQPSAGTFSTAADTPAAGTGFWYLFRAPGTITNTGLCNDITWGDSFNDLRDVHLP